MKLGKVKVKLFVLCMAGLLGLVVHGDEVKAAGETKIHFISLNSTTDAILLESNGHYGMVDSGEDWDYPDGVTYPLRDGVTKGIGYEQQVIHYLKTLGVEKLDFYIATHSHSDHIGSGDEILDAFPTERLYIKQYDDAYIIDAHGKDPNDPYYHEGANEARLWDNQYVYDQIIEAANRNGTQIINLDLEEHKQDSSFTMGDMSIQLMNLERRIDENGTVIPVADENDNCIVTKITAFDRVALLTADMDPTEGDTAKVAQQLIEELGDQEEVEVPGDIDIQLEGSYAEENYEEESNVELDLPENRTVLEESQNDTGIDESKKNTGKTISIDLMKMSHHSIDYNNTTYFLTSLNPKAVVITGYESWFNARERDCLPNADLYATATDSAAVVATFSEDGIETEYEKVEPEWQEMNGQWYYFDENGRNYTDQGAHEIDGKIYCFDQNGALSTVNRWVQVNGKWKYWLTEGEFYKGDWLEENGNWYYLEQDGEAITGWKEIGGQWYYFNSNCSLATDTWIGNYYVNEFGVWEPEATRDEWVLSGNRWWYRHADGSYTKSGWEMINDSWYYFDEAGWMVTGWQWVGSKCYYLTSSGAMAADTWIGEYYVDTSGAWIPGLTRDEWILSGSRWWYRHADGSYTRSGWEMIDGSWYYFDGAGWMVTGWLNLGQAWYYLDPSGAMVSSAWVGNYYLKADGKMAVSEWVEDGKYYVDENGKRV